MMPDFLEYTFLVRAILAGVGVAILAGPLGCFVVWRRMAYFGDSLAHAGLLGIAISFVFHLNASLGIILSSLSVALIIATFRRLHRIAVDTLLGILAHSTLAIGLVALSFFPEVRVDLNAFLFGDILAVSTIDLIWIYVSGGVIIAVLIGIWRQILLITLHEELAIAEGVKTFPIQLSFMIIFAVFIAIAMKIVGVLLVTSMLLLPAASARTFAKSPEAMASLSSILGIIAVVCGIWLSYTLDTPAGPSIVVIAVIILLITVGIFSLLRLLHLKR